MERDGLGEAEGDAERDALALGDAERDADGDGEADREAFGLGEASGEPGGARLATGPDGFASSNAVSVFPGSEDPPSASASAVPPRATTVQAPARMRASRFLLFGPPPPPRPLHRRVPRGDPHRSPRPAPWHRPRNTPRPGLRCTACPGPRRTPRRTPRPGLPRSPGPSGAPGRSPLRGRRWAGAGRPGWCPQGASRGRGAGGGRDRAQGDRVVRPGLWRLWRHGYAVRRGVVHRRGRRRDRGQQLRRGIVGWAERVAGRRAGRIGHRTQHRLRARRSGSRLPGVGQGYVRANAQGLKPAPGAHSQPTPSAPQSGQRSALTGTLPGHCLRLCRPARPGPTLPRGHNRTHRSGWRC